MAAIGWIIIFFDIYVLKATYIMKTENEKHLIADEGKVLKNIQSDVIMGRDVYMDKICINGVYIDDFAENYEEINEIKPMME